MLLIFSSYVDNRKKWSLEEAKIFEKYWQPDEGALPTRECLDTLHRLLPDRSVVTLRARASNLIKSHALKVFKEMKNKQQ